MTRLREPEAHYAGVNEGRTRTHKDEHDNGNHKN